MPISNLRKLMPKGAVFQWGQKEQECYEVLMRMLSDTNILTPFVQGVETHVMVDACKEGIGASLY